MRNKNTKYAKGDNVFVRIPAKYAGVPTGVVKQVKIHSISTWKEEISRLFQKVLDFSLIPCYSKG